MTLALLSRNLFLGLALAAVACGKTYDCDSSKDGDDLSCPSGAATGADGGSSQVGGSGSGGSDSGAGGSPVASCDPCLLQEEELYTGITVFPARRPGVDVELFSRSSGLIFTRDDTHFYVLGHGVSAVSISTGEVTIPVSPDPPATALAAHSSGAVVLQAHAGGLLSDKFGGSTLRFLSAGAETSTFDGDADLMGLASNDSDLFTVGSVKSVDGFEDGVVRIEENSLSLDIPASVFESVSLFVLNYYSSRLLPTENALWVTAGATPTLVKVVDGEIAATAEYSGGPTLGFRICGGDVYIAANDITRFTQEDAGSELVVEGNPSGSRPVISSFACNDWGIFWTVNAGGDSGGTLFGMAYGSSVPEPLMKEMTHPAAMLTEDDVLYWLSSGPGGVGSEDAWLGSIHRVDLAPLYDLP